MTRSPGTVYYLTSAVLGLFFLIVIPSSVFASYWYASPTGSGTTCSSESPCTLNYAVNTKATPGDTVYVKDGTYNQLFQITSSGTSDSARITVKALNDGQAIISGQASTYACYMNNVRYLDIEGLICKDAYDGGGIYITNGSDHINIRRVSTSGESTKQEGGFNIVNSSYILLEDCIAYGWTRVQYNIYEGHHNTLRRCWGIFQNYNLDSQPRALVQLYGTDDAIVENFIGTSSNESETVEGLVIWANTYNDTADRNKIYGAVIYDLTYWAYGINSAQHNITSNEWKNIIGIDCTYGFLQRADDNHIIDNMTMAGVGNNNFYIGADSDTKDGDWGVKGTVINSSFFSGYRAIYAEAHSQGFISLTNDYNNLYGMTYNYGHDASQGDHDTFVNPGYNTSTYGKGAYLMVPTALKGQGQSGADMGAKVLYRYQNGTLTNDPLWPWPMESRACSETGYSVTYETGYTGCTSGGGIWKTLNGVYTGEGTGTGLCKLYLGESCVL